MGPRLESRSYEDDLRDRYLSGQGDYETVEESEGHDYEGEDNEL